jgi:tetratricopeptide (TPR) repeat protein
MRRLIITFFLIFNVAFAQKKDYKNFDKAVKFNNNGNIEKSIKYANKALKNTPGWNEPTLLLAAIYANKKKITLAANYLLRVYDENNPQDKKGVLQLAKLYYSNGFYNKALFYFKKVINFDLDMNTYSIELYRYVENCEFAIKSVNNPVEFNPINLGSSINSQNEEYLPAISVDGKILVYSRRIVRNNILQEDFFYYRKK